MARNKTTQDGISLRSRVTAWLAAILLVTMLSTGIATMAGQWTVRSFDTLLADNAVCYTVQNALKDETQAFARYVRQPTSEAYTAACTASEQSLAALPFDYARIGEERYARTWNLLQGYAGYRQERDAFLQLSPSADTYIEQMYHVMALQDYLAEYALRLTQATLEQENALYSSTAAHIRHLPWLYLALFLTAVVLVALQLAWLAWVFFALTTGAARVWVTGVLNGLSLLIILYLVRKDENSAYKVGWIALIGLLPLLGGALYLAFGNKRPSRRLRSKMQAVEQAHRADRAQQPGQTAGLGDENRGVSRYLTQYGCYPAWQNTTARYFSCGEAMYPALLADLEKAEKSIFLEFFIISQGKMWQDVEDILRRKAAQGVDVRLIYDDFGSLLGLPKDFVVRMERAHIRCIPFNPVVPLLSLVMNHRDHRKIVVIDGTVAYTGGVNLADEYINAEQRFGYWKDAALRVEGDAAWNFTVMFLNFWNAFRPSETDYSAFRPQHSAHPVQDGIVQPYADSPLDEEPVAETVYLNLLARAEQYVYIYTPYLAVGEEMLDALKNAAKRGVDVRLVLPGIPDKKLVFRLSRSYYLPLLRAGVRIYEFTPGFLHAKCYVSDDRAAVVGSINMDYRSLFLHFECGALLLYNSQVIALRDDVLRTLPECREVQLADCRTSLAGTLLDSVLRLLSPLM